MNGIPNIKAEGEDEYIQYWKKLSNRVEPYSYRLFSRYMGRLPYIIPEDIAKFHIEMHLNPRRYRSYYSDKNLYHQYMSHHEYFPKTIARRINGSVLLGEDYLPLGEFPSDLHYDSLIVKPSVDSSSGRGIRLFKKEGGHYVSNGDVLTKEFLLGFGGDLIVQEAVKQHPFFSQFNETSVNTMRIAAYRSVLTEEVILTSGVVRIGVKGAYVDNAHAGGRLVGINMIDGTLNHVIYDQNGRGTSEWNGIDFRKNHFQIPCWDKIKNVAKYVVSQNRHCRLLALDITLTPEGTPMLIEENCTGFGYWVLQFTGQDVFAGHTDEVVAYCSNKDKQLKKERKIL